MKKLTIGDFYFVEKSEFVSTLFNAGGTAAGFYKTYKNRVEFFRPNGEVWFAACRVKDGKVFASVSTDNKCRKIYSYLSTRDSEKLFPGLGFCALNEKCAEILNNFGI